MANTTKEMTVFRVPLANGTTQEYEIVDASARASLQNKQNTLTFDSTPTANSTNPITSGGVYTAISNISPSSGGSSNNSTVEMEWVNVYSQWQAGYYYDPDNDFAYTQIPSTETTWGETQTYISTSCTPYSNLIPVKTGERWRYQNMPVHFDSKNAEVPSIIIFDSNKAEIQAYTRTYQDEWTEFTIPANGVWMAVLYANSQTYNLQKYDVKPFDKKELLNIIMADYKSYSLTVPPTPRTLTKALICLGTDDLRPAETKSLYELFTTNNIPYYMASIPTNIKACVTDDPYKTNLDYMQLCVQNGGEIICHSADVITEANKNNFDAMYTYFAEFKKQLEFYGFKVRGIFKAGGENAIYYPSDPVIDAWAMHYYDFGDYFRDAFPYNMERSLLDDWADYSYLANAIQTAVQNKGYFIGAFHYYNANAETAISTILSTLQGYTKGVDYDFVTPSQLFDALMPTTIPSGGGGSGVDTNTTYRLSMASNTITLTGSDSSTSNVTLPIYDGSSDSSGSGGQGGGSSSLSGLSDVSVSNLTNGQILKYNGTGWSNSTPTWAEITETDSINIFDKTDIITDSVLLPWDGSTLEQDSMFHSFIPCETGTYTFLVATWLYGGNANRVPLFDANKVYVDEVTGTLSSYDSSYDILTVSISSTFIQNGVAYFGFSNSISLLDSLMVIKGTTYPSTYIAFGTTRTINGLQLYENQIIDYSAESNPLKNKIAVFTGDSICAGAGFTGGYASIISSENNMIIQNEGVGGGTIVPTENMFCISTSITDLRSDADYVILEGGANDSDIQVPIGTLTVDYASTLDTTTFAGAFENMLKSAIERFPTAKIGYVFVHKCANRFNSTDTSLSTSYYQVAKNACIKWGIPYCDLNSNTPPLGYITSLKTAYTANGDGYHPNEQGYRLFYVPKITAWMKTL